jgi:hypothetical protein
MFVISFAALKQNQERQRSTNFTGALRHGIGEGMEINASQISESIHAVER